MKKREIKLRAWDNDQKEMFQGEIEQYDDMLGFRFEHFGLVPEEDVTYMQFTGLKDKNSVEIYEGDIVHYKKHKGYLCDSFVGEIIWLEEEAAWGYRVFGYDYAFNNADEVQFDILNHIEVIGNIFENAELVNEAI